MEEARARLASDIHFSVVNENCLISLRVNELLIPIQEIRLSYYDKLVMYIKFKSNMNLNNSRTPQSSALNLVVNDTLIRIRVSTLPSNEHESIVFRINNSRFTNSIFDLILLPEQVRIFSECRNKKSGLMLITGPTGSGKTTLTYCVLKQLKEMGLSVVTIEDPVEHYEKGFVQLEINDTAGVTYETGVKEILRHDPDCIFIGEIRDSNTAKSAVRASLTGHLVISTMHAVDCLKALYRFIEFGLSIHDIEQTLILVTNQRLLVYEENKKIVLEYLDYNKILEALSYIKIGGEFKFKRIADYLNEYDNYSIIKK